MYEASIFIIYHLTCYFDITWRSVNAYDDFDFGDAAYCI